MWYTDGAYKTGGAPLLTNRHLRPRTISRRSTCAVLLLISVLIALPLAAHAAPSNMERVGVAEGGRSTTVIVDGGYAYVGTGRVLVVFDLADPANPVRVANEWLPDAVLDLAVAGDYLYAAAGLAGLLVIDKSNPAAPLHVATSNTPQVAAGLALSGDYAYIADGVGGLRVIDISTPSAPFQASFNAGVGTAYDAFVVGNHLYLAVDSQVDLRIFTLSTPSTPVEIATFNRTSRRGEGVFVSGTHCFLIHGCIDFSVVNVSVPTSPWLEGAPTPVPCSGDDVTIVGDIMYLSMGIFGVHVFDVSLQSNPVHIATLDPGVGHGVGFTLQTAVSGNYAYVATREGGLSVFEVANPASPVEVFQRKGWDGALGVFAKDNYAYVSVDYDVLKVVDIANRETPAVVGEMVDVGSGGSSVVVHGDYAYVGNLHVINVSDPTNPSHELLYTDPIINSTVNAMDAEGDYLYAARGSWGLRVYRITDPALPQPWSGFFTIGAARDVIIDGAVAYLIDGAPQFGVRVVDVSDPQFPVEIGNYFTPGTAWALALEDDRLYVADFDNGLLILDVSTPSTPIKMGELLTFTDATDVAVNGDFAYVVDGTTVRMVDVSNPVSPQEVGNYDDTIGSIRVSDAGGADILIVDWPVGLQVVRNLLLPTSIDDAVALPRGGLEQNYPNPFNPTTTFRYTVAADGAVRLQVFDVSGRLVRTLVDEYQAGSPITRTISWNGRDDAGTPAPSGVYLYKLTAGGFTDTRKMVLLK
jgi:hypothetical protein